MLRSEIYYGTIVYTCLLKQGATLVERSEKGFYRAGIENVGGMTLESNRHRHATAAAGHAFNL